MGNQLKSSRWTARLAVSEGYSPLSMSLVFLIISQTQLHTYEESQIAFKSISVFGVDSEISSATQLHCCGLKKAYTYQATYTFVVYADCMSWYSILFNHICS